MPGYTSRLCPEIFFTHPFSVAVKATTHFYQCLLKVTGYSRDSITLMLKDRLRW